MKNEQHQEPGQLIEISIIEPLIAFFTILYIFIKIATVTTSLTAFGIFCAVVAAAAIVIFSITLFVKN